VEKQNLGK